MQDDIQEEIGQEGEEQEVKKRKGKPLLFLLIIFLVLGLGAGAAYYFYGPRIMTMLTGKSSAPEGAHKEKKRAPGPIMTLEPFIFNLSGNPSKFAKISIGIEVKNVKLEEETKKMMPAIRDRILLVLGAKPAEVFLDVNQRNLVKEELQRSLKTLFRESDDLSAVYITDIIIQ